MKRKILLFLKNGLNLTLGRILRLLQTFLTPKLYSTNLRTELETIAIKDSAFFATENFHKAIYFENRYLLHEYLLKKIKSGANTVVLEFGVWKGESINFFSANLPQINFFGFDSFEGLEEDWPGFNYLKGTFSTDGQLPKVEENVKLVVGWFKDTLPKFIENDLTSKFIGMVHLDADTFTPTEFVLNALKDHLEPGTVILFDEFFGYPNWRNHEFAAWVNFCDTFKIHYEYIAFSNQQVALLIQ
jgi:hypothetical protein